jgi:hypothetical protein
MVWTIASVSIYSQHDILTFPNFSQRYSYFVQIFLLAAVVDCYENKLYEAGGRDYPKRLH